MNDFREMPRIYINWDRARPTTLRGWIAAIAIVALSIAALALFAIIASTLLVIALIVGIGAAASWYIGNLFRRPGRRREIVRYRGNPDA